MKPILALAAAFAAAGATAAVAAIDVRFSGDPGTTSYRKVFIAPAKVEFDRQALREARSVGDPAQHLSDGDVRRIGNDMGESFRTALAEAFAAKGFEVQAAPSSDALRIVPALQDLYVHAPEGSTPGIAKSYVREAGTVTLAAEGLGGRGERLLWARDRAVVGRTLDFNRASDVSNRFWFETEFRRWAEDLALAVAARK